MQSISCRTKRGCEMSKRHLLLFVLFQISRARRSGNLKREKRKRKNTNTLEQPPTGFPLLFTRFESQLLLNRRLAQSGSDPETPYRRGVRKRPGPRHPNGRSARRSAPRPNKVACLRTKATRQPV